MSWKLLRKKGIAMKHTALWSLVLTVATLSPSAYGQDPKADLQKRLSAVFVPTKMTADNSDIVTAGSVLVLQKDGLVMYGVDSKVAPTNTYKDGKLGIGFGAMMGIDMQLGMVQQGVNHLNVPQRKFVAGEKFWTSSIAVKDDGVVFLFFSDPFNDVRYCAQLKIPFAKKSIPPADDLLKTIAEVITVQPAEGSSQTEAPPPSQPAAQLPQIAPPPPPADAPPPAPKTISLGQTKDMVVAILGQPAKVAIVGKKEIDYYPDMKVIFIDGKVTDIQ
jgi:hypothetical protein